MTVFFSWRGLELKRSLVEGMLVELMRAALPWLATLGGVLFPAGIHWALNRGGPAVMMELDVAFG